MEFAELLGRTFTIWWQLLPTLAALTLLGWTAYHASVLGAAQLAAVNAWLVIPVLALGVLLRLATLVIAMRAVAHRLGTVKLLREVFPDEVIDDDRDRNLLRLVSLTLLPFLGIYAAFGYVQQFARDVVILSDLSLGFAGLLNQLNPLSSVTSGVVMAATVVALFVTRRILDALFDRTENPLLGALAVFIEATLLLLIALSGFRVYEQLSLWAHDRTLMQWWDLAVAGLTGWVYWDLPPVMVSAWQFLTEAFWPVLWDIVSKPIAWLALTALVVGSRLRSFAELWNHPQTDVNQADHGRAARLRVQLAGRPRLRRVAVHLQDAFFGDIDDKYLPVWQSVQMVVRAGWTHLGAFVLAYGIIGLGGQWIVAGTLRLVGGASATTALTTAPLIDLIPDVVVMSVQLCLLGVAFTHIVTGRANANAAPAPRHPNRSGRFAEIAVVFALMIGFTGVWMARPSEAAAERSAAMGSQATLDAQIIRIDSVSYGSNLTVDQRAPVHTDAAFVVVRITCYRPSADGEPIGLELVNGSREYSAGGWGSIPTLPQPGFEITNDVVFEVAPADLNSSLTARVTPATIVTAFHDEVVVNLGVPDTAAMQLSNLDVTASSLGSERAR